MSANHINMSPLGKEVSIQRMYDTCLMSHLALEGDFTTSELRDIHFCHMFKGIYFMRDICNYQGNNLQQSVTDTFTTFNLIHDFNWPRKHHKKISAWGMWKKSMRTLCDESKYELHKPLGKCRLEDNKYITCWQCFLPCDLHTI